MVIVLNKDCLNDLFKPYELDFVTAQDMDELLNLSDEFVMILDMELECSKSRDELCNNQVCYYNMISKHSDALYIKLAKDGGDVYAKASD